MACKILISRSTGKHSSFKSHNMLYNMLNVIKLDLCRPTYIYECCRDYLLIIKIDICNKVYVSRFKCLTISMLA